MKMTQMPDGSTVSTPFYVGTGGPPPLCTSDCHWVTRGKPQEIRPDAGTVVAGVKMTTQVCPKCLYQRMRIVPDELLAEESKQ